MISVVTFHSDSPVFKNRLGGVGTRYLYEDCGPEEPGDGVWPEGLRGSGDLPDAGGGGHLQGPGEEHTTIQTSQSEHMGMETTKSKICSCPLVWLFSDFDLGCD